MEAINHPRKRRRVDHPRTVTVDASTNATAEAEENRSWRREPENVRTSTISLVIENTRPRRYNLRHNSRYFSSFSDHEGSHQSKRKHSQPRAADGTFEDSDSNVDSESDSNLFADSNDDDDDSAFPELFGQVVAWKDALEAAMTIGQSQIKGQSVRHTLPGVQTKFFRDFLRKIKNAHRCYEKLSRDDMTVAIPLDEILAGIESDVQSVRDYDREDKRGRRTIQDIYAHGIPRLVRLLGKAMTTRSSSYSMKDEEQSLQEMIRIQEGVISLCRRASLWKAEPETYIPIKGTTSNKIYPRLRKVRDAFRTELDNRREAKRHRKFGAALKCQQVRAAEELEEERKSRQSEKERRRRQGAMDALNRLHLDRRLQQRLPPKEPPRMPQTSPDMWTKELTLELLRRLEEGYSPVQPSMLFREKHHIVTFSDIYAGTERYLHILSGPPLHNMLPEHVRQQALAMKPQMEKVYRRDGIVPAWISSIG